MKKGVIYCIENIINNKKYIGKTANFKERKYSHFYKLKNNIHVNNYLQNSWNKYKKENFKMYKIEDDIPLRNLNEREIYWINYYNTFKGDGYNLTVGGEGFDCGEKHPHYGVELSKEHKEKISKKLKGRDFSLEHKIKLSKKKQGKNHHFYGIKGEEHPRYGKKHTENTKEKISKTKRNKSKIKYKDVYTIMKLYFEENMTQKEISNLYNYKSTSIISNILNLKHWLVEDLVRR